MSHNGIWLIGRVGLVSVLIAVVAVARVLVGPGKKRGRIMLAGTLGGIASGVLVASALPSWFKSDLSAICAVVGILIGWGVSWQFARQFPREAN